MRTQKFLLLVVTGMPGLYKLIIFFVIKSFFSSITIATYINDTSWSTIFGYFTYANFITYVVKDFPVLSVVDQKKYLNNLTIYVLQYTFLFSLLGLMLYFFNYIEDILGFFLFTLFSSLYYVFRYLYIVNRKYLKLVIFEILLLGLSVLIILLIKDKYLLIANSLCFLFFYIICFLELRLYKHFSYRKSLLQRISTKQLMHYGTINLTASGLYLLLAPLSYQILTSTYTTLIGLINNISGILLLFTRSLSNHFSPLLALHKKDIFYIYHYLKKFKRYLNMFLFLGAITSVVVLLGLLFYKSPLYSVLYVQHAITIIILYIVAITMGQISLPASSLFVILEKEYIMLMANVYQAIAVILSSVVITFMLQNISNNIKFEIILVILIISNIGRYFYFKMIEKRLCNMYK